MKVFNLPRGAGKSIRMLYASEFHNAPILCHSIASKMHLIDCAKNYGINIPEPICLFELDSGKNLKRHGDILVDEALLVLNKMLNTNGNHFNIIGCTLSDNDSIKY